jgi:hypothetical protein
MVKMVGVVADGRLFAPPTPSTPKGCYGTLTEAFGSGTAAVISPVGSLYFKDHYLVNNNQIGTVLPDFSINHS